MQINPVFPGSLVPNSSHKRVRDFDNEKLTVEPLRSFASFKKIRRINTTASITPSRLTVVTNATKGNLFDAVMKHDSKRVSENILSGVSLNDIDLRGRPPLYYAIQAGDQDIVEALIKAGADCSLLYCGELLLHEAFRRPNQSIRKLLLSHTSDLNLVAPKKEHILFQIAKQGDWDGLNLLVNSGTKLNLDAENSSGETPIFSAIHRNRHAIVQQLIFHGADVDHKDNNGKTPAMMALECDDLVLLSLLLDSGADINAKDNEGNSLFHHAIISQNIQAIELLHSKGADIKACFPDGYTPLMYALMSKRNNSAEKLIALGCDVNEPSVERTPLAIAIKKNLAMVEPLLNAGADPDIRDKFKQTALLQATSVPLEIFKKIFEKAKEKNPNDGNWSLLTLLKINNVPDRLSKLEFVRGSLPYYVPFESEYLKRVTLSNVWEIEGSSQMKISDKEVRFVDYEGGHSIYLLKQTSKGIKEFILEYPDLISKEKGEILVKSLSNAINEDSKESFDAWERGEPVIVDAGFDVHSTKILFWKNNMIECNRMLRDDAFPIFASHINTKTLTREGIKTITSVKDEQEKISNKAFKKLKQTLQAKKGDVQYYFEKQKMVGFQNVGNCPIASSEGIIYAYLVLYEWMKTPISTHFSPIAEDQAFILKNIIAYSQVRALEKYLAFHKSHPDVVIDKGLLSDIMTKGVDLEADERIQERTFEALAELNYLHS